MSMLKQIFLKFHFESRNTTQLVRATQILTTQNNNKINKVGPVQDQEKIDYAVALNKTQSACRNINVQIITCNTVCHKKLDHDLIKLEKGDLH